MALGVDVSYGSVLFIVLLINVISLIPISINGWGLREGAFVLMFTQVGVGGGEALAVALLGRVTGILKLTVGGILSMTHK